MPSPLRSRMVSFCKLVQRTRTTIESGEDSSMEGVRSVYMVGQYVPENFHDGQSRPRQRLHDESIGILKIMNGQASWDFVEDFSDCFFPVPKLKSEDRAEWLDNRITLKVMKM